VKKNHIVIALCLILGCDQKENFLDINGYINDFYLSKPYYHDRKKEIESIYLFSKTNVKLNNNKVKINFGF